MSGGQRDVAANAFKGDFENFKNLMNE